MLLQTPDVLPNRLQSLKQIVLVKVLTMTPPYSSKSLLTLDNPFSGPLEEFERHKFDEFQNKLGKIEETIRDRNNGLLKLPKPRKPYTYLLPSRIPQSIAI